jgi:hypothetical protein
MTTAHLQFGKATWPPTPMQTIGVPIKESLLPWQEASLSYPLDVYGRKIPSRYMVQWQGRWRRVYIACFGNASTHYIGDFVATVDICRSN